MWIQYTYGINCFYNMQLSFDHSSNMLPEYIGKDAWPKTTEMHLIIVDSNRLIVQTCWSKRSTHSSHRSHSTTMPTQLASVTTTAQRWPDLRIRSILFYINLTLRSQRLPCIVPTINYTFPEHTNLYWHTLSVLK
jgi:hypothetical protein